MDQNETQQRLESARKWAIEAGRLTLEYFRHPDLSIEKKDDDSPVTKADRESELLLRKRISEQFPTDQIIGEEFGSQSKDANDWAWYLDPIDGTQSFARGVAQYGVLIGIAHKNKPVASTIYLPALNEMLWADIEGDCMWDNAVSDLNTQARPTSVSKVTLLSDALICQTSGQAFRYWTEAHQAITKAAHAERGWGDCVGHCYVATGRAEAMLDPGLKPWDVCALIPIIEAAGGRITAFDKHNPSPLEGDFFSTNGHLHDQITHFLQQYPKATNESQS